MSAITTTDAREIDADVLTSAELHCVAAASCLATAASIIDSAAFRDDRLSQSTVQQIERIRDQVEQVTELLGARAKVIRDLYEQSS